MHYIENVILASRSCASVSSDILSGCLNPMELRMRSVMDSCESQPNFTSYVSCIKTNYKRNPSASTVRSLIAQLNSINEDYENGSISEIKARAAARIAYDDTVGEGNARQTANAAASYRAPMTCTTYGNTKNCY